MKSSEGGKDAEFDHLPLRPPSQNSSEKCSSRALIIIEASIVKNARLLARALLARNISSLSGSYLTEKLYSASEYSLPFVCAICFTLLGRSVGREAFTNSAFSERFPHCHFIVTISLFCNLTFVFLNSTQLKTNEKFSLP